MKEELKLHQAAKVCYVCGKIIFKKVKKVIRKLDFIVTIQVNIEVHHIVFVI